MKRIVGWTVAVLAVALLGCVTPQAAVDESATFKARIIDQLNTVADESATDYGEIAAADAEDAWASEALKYWTRARRPGETSETLTLFVQQSAEATRTSLATAERRRALRVQKIRNAAKGVDTYGKMKDAERAREEWIELLLKGANSTEVKPDATNP